VLSKLSEKEIVVSKLGERHTLIYHLLELLRASADAEKRGHISNREIGQRLDCSIGSLPDHWRTLESQGILVREKIDRSGTTYRLLEPGEESPSPPMRERSAPPRPAKQRPIADLAGQLERLERMWRRGSLTDSEFHDFKQALRTQARRG
jgi:hypothetical protein